MKITNSRISTILFLIITLTYCSGYQELIAKSENLFPIIENGLWGYIDQNGKIEIVPKFLTANKFSDGLAAVRLKGTYGYIDRTGEFVLQPQYDYALSFKNGIAKVFFDSKPYYIDKNGNKLFEHDFIEILGFENNNYSVVETKTKKLGVIDLRGNLIIDTVFIKFSPFSKEGLASVIGENHDPYPDDNSLKVIYEVGVINLNGDFVVPYGKYETISEFRNGYAKVEFIKDPTIKNDYKIGMIDTTGNIKFMIPLENWSLDYSKEQFSCGLAIVSIKNYEIDTLDKIGFKTSKRYMGVINELGEIIFSNHKWRAITPFHYNRAFIQDTNYNWYLINKEGTILNEDPYKRLIYDSYSSKVEDLFEDGKQIVKTSKGWGAIDTNGNFVIEPKKIEALTSDSFRKKNIIAIIENQVNEDKYPYLLGFWNIKSEKYVKPQFHSIDYDGFEEELVYVFQDGRLGYIDHNGNYIWREAKSYNPKEITFNIDYMKRGSYYASSPYKEELAGFGGWSSSENAFKKISDQNEFSNNELSLKAASYKDVKYLEKYDAIKLSVANTAVDTFFFDVQDSRLYLKLQAKDRYGIWKDIEYLPSSWCGNSYHSLFLPPNRIWEFIIPVFDGEFKTTLRAELLYKTNSEDKIEKSLYSNEFEGSINPGQFWRMEEYYPSGIMDPYND